MVTYAPAQDWKKWHSLPDMHVEQSSLCLEPMYVHARQRLPPIMCAFFFVEKWYIQAQSGQFSGLKNELCAHKCISTCMCGKKRQQSLPNLFVEQGGLRLDIHRSLCTKLSQPPITYICMYVHNQLSSLTYEKRCQTLLLIFSWIAWRTQTWTLRSGEKITLDIEPNSLCLEHRRLPPISHVHMSPGRPQTWNQRQSTKIKD